MLDNQGWSLYIYVQALADWTEIEGCMEERWEAATALGGDGSYNAESQSCSPCALDSTITGSGTGIATAVSIRMDREFMSGLGREIYG